MPRKILCAVLACASLITAPVVAEDVDLSPLVGTLEVEFQSMQSAGIRHGCTLVYRTLGRDHAYRKGAITTLVGNISYQSNDARSGIVLGLKVGIVDDLFRGNFKPIAPFFAYLQTPNGTTARSKFIQFDSDTPGYRIFAYRLDGEAVKVFGDIANGAPVIIGFNRKKGGLDVLVPLDLGVAEAIPSDSGFNRRRSDAMLSEFIACVDDVTSQVQKQLETK